MTDDAPDDDDHDDDAPAPHRSDLPDRIADVDATRTGETSEPGKPGETAEPGERIVHGAWWGTAAFGVTAVLATAVPALAAPALAVAVALFAAGTGAFFAAYARAIGRSRTEQIGVMNLFFLDHSAPRPVRRNLLGALAVQIAVAMATAALRPNTSVAFGVLAPVYGLGLAGLWGARHGTFPTRAPRQERRPRTPN